MILRFGIATALAWLLAAVLSGALLLLRLLLPESQLFELSWLSFGRLISFHVLAGVCGGGLGLALAALGGALTAGARRARRLTRLAPAAGLLAWHLGLLVLGWGHLTGRATGFPLLDLAPAGGGLLLAGLGFFLLAALLALLRRDGAARAPAACAVLGLAGLVVAVWLGARVNWEAGWSGYREPAAPARLVAAPLAVGATGGGEEAAAEAPVPTTPAGLAGAFRRGLALQVLLFPGLTALALALALITLGAPRAPPAAAPPTAPPAERRGGGLFLAGLLGALAFLGPAGGALFLPPDELVPPAARLGVTEASLLLILPLGAAAGWLWRLAGRMGRATPGDPAATLLRLGALALGALGLAGAAGSLPTLAPRLATTGWPGLLVLLAALAVLLSAQAAAYRALGRGRRTWPVRLHLWLSALGLLLVVLAFAGGALASLRALETAPRFAETLAALRPYYMLRGLGGGLLLLGLAAFAVELLRPVFVRGAPAGDTDAEAPAPARPDRARRWLLPASPALLLWLLLPAWRDARLHDNPSGAFTGRRPSVSLGREPRPPELVGRQALPPGTLPRFLADQPRISPEERERLAGLARREVAAREHDILILTADSPREARGRAVFLREGCAACHTQRVRDDPVERRLYGPPTVAGESLFDRLPVTGLRRLGPDLAREGARRSDGWLYAHLADPRQVVPESLMPRYPWLFTEVVVPASWNGERWVFAAAAHAELDRDFDPSAREVLELTPDRAGRVAVERRQPLHYSRAGGRQLEQAGVPLFSEPRDSPEPLVAPADALSALRATGHEPTAVDELSRRFLTAAAVLDWPEFCQALAAGEAGAAGAAASAPVRRLWELLPETAREIVRRNRRAIEVSDDDQVALLNVLNPLLERADLFGEAEGRELPARPDAAEDALEEVRQLNRRLLTAAFPGLVGPGSRMTDPRLPYRPVLHVPGDGGPLVRDQTQGFVSAAWRAAGRTEMPIRIVIVEPDAVALVAYLQRLGQDFGDAWLRPPADFPLDPTPPPAPTGAAAAAELERAKALYQLQCAGCHGPEGDGDGTAACFAISDFRFKINPEVRPRDFGPGIFKYKSRPPHSFASPGHVYRVLALGLAGTSMSAGYDWLSEADRWALARYVTEELAGAERVRRVRFARLPEAAAVRLTGRVRAVLAPLELAPETYNPNEEAFVAGTVAPAPPDQPDPPSGAPGWLGWKRRAACCLRPPTDEPDGRTWLVVDDERGRELFRQLNGRTAEALVKLDVGREESPWVRVSDFRERPAEPDPADAFPRRLDRRHPVNYLKCAQCHGPGVTEDASYIKALNVWHANCGPCHGDQGRADGSQAMLLRDDWGYPITPRNFATGQFRSGWSAAALCLRVGRGIAGTPMPSINLTEEHRWLAAHFAQALIMRLRGAAAVQKTPTTHQEEVVEESNLEGVQPTPRPKPSPPPPKPSASGKEP